MREKRKEIILIIILTGIFLAIGFSIKGIEEGILFDEKVLSIFHSRTIPLLVSLSKIISFIGSVYFILPATLIILLWTIRKKEFLSAKLIAMSTLGSYTLNYIFKHIFKRTRPIEYFRIDYKGLSFPSGHSMVAMTFYLTIGFLLKDKIKSKKGKRIIKYLTIGMILLMGLSRIYLGVHWPTDVIGGYLIGYVFYYISINIIKK